MVKLLYYEEHFSCKNYASDVQQGFKHMVLEPNSELINEDKNLNYLIFILKGELNVSSNESSKLHFKEGEIFLIPQLSSVLCTTLCEVSLMICIFQRPPSLCDKIELESLSPLCMNIEYTITTLEIRPMMADFLDLLKLYLKSSVNCKHLHEIKYKELFLIFRAYYTKEEVATLFQPIIGQSLDFRELVVKNYLQCSKVQQLAKSCGFSTTTFNEKFRAEFHTTPLKWMQKQKAVHIKNRLTNISLSIKDIVDEFQFASQTHLNTYCKKFFGVTAFELRSKITSENDHAVENIHPR